MKKSKISGSVIYAIFGVCTLIISLIGSSYAYYNASINNDSVINGTASMNSNGVNENNALSINVTKISTGADGTIMPIVVGTNTTNLNNAAKGWDTSTNNYSTAWNPLYACTNNYGDTVCQIYSVTVTNNLKQVQHIKIGITSLSGATVPNVDAVKMNSTTSISSITSIKGDSSGITNVVSIPSEGTSSTYYFMIFIRDVGAQTDYGEFGGVVTATNSDYGTTISARFS